jgi:tetratricopeptide (TPR) repeat protein
VKLRSLVAALVVTATAPAFAQSSDAAKEARDLYERGVRHYNVREYDAAIEDFKRAYLLSATPSLLFNLAQAYRQKGPGSCADAAAAYRAYLRERPNAADRKTIEGHIDNLDACAKSEPPAKKEPPPPPPPEVEGTPTPPVLVEEAPPPSPRRNLSTPSLVLGGSGIVLLGTGALLNGLARVRYSDLQSECPCPPERWETWRDVETTSWIVVGAGAATLAAAVVVWLVSSTPQRSAAR